MRILLDTNILLRFVEPMHQQHSVSRSAVDLLRRNDHDLVIVPQVLYEFWTVATRPTVNNGLGMTVSDVVRQLSLLKRLFLLLRDERAIYEMWEQLVDSLQIKGKPSHDARLAAAMQRHGVTHLLTFNGPDFARFAFVIAWNPTEVVAGTVGI